MVMYLCAWLFLCGFMKAEKTCHIGVVKLPYLTKVVNSKEITSARVFFVGSKTNAC